MRHRIAALMGAGMMIATLGAAAPAAASAKATSPSGPDGAGRRAGIHDMRFLALAGEDRL